jgi:hypothetical protein
MPKAQRTQELKKQSTKKKAANKPKPKPKPKNPTAMSAPMTDAQAKKAIANLKKNKLSARK